MFDETTQLATSWPLRNHGQFSFWSWSIFLLQCRMIEIKWLVFHNVNTLSNGYTITHSVLSAVHVKQWKIQLFTYKTIVIKKWLWNTFQIGWFLGKYSMQICCSTPETNSFHTISILILVLECANCQSYFNFLFRDILVWMNASSFPLFNHFRT